MDSVSTKEAQRFSAVSAASTDDEFILIHLGSAGGANICPQPLEIGGGQVLASTTASGTLNHHTVGSTLVGGE